MLLRRIAGFAGYGVGTLGLMALGGLLGLEHRERRLTIERTNEDRRGPAAYRCFEVATALLKRHKIEDRETRERHFALVESLSSRDYTNRAALEAKEKATSCSKDNLYREVENGVPSNGDLVFRLTKELPSKTEGFVYAGRTDRLTDSEARADIIDGNYAYCEHNIPRQIDYRNHTRVIITGTTDSCGKCDELGKQFFEAIIRSAATEEGISDEYPLSVTLVKRVTKEGVKSSGDLTELSEPDKESIRLGNFVPCDYYNLQKTRLSRGGYVKVGAVVTGATDPAVCKDLSEQNLFKVLDEVRRQIP